MLIIKKFLAMLLAAMLFSTTCAYSEGGNKSISAQSYVLMCGDKVIYEKNAELELPMASTTKLMTALIAAENCGLTEQVDITEECCGTEGSSMYLRDGEVLTVEELIKGLLLVSGNDAAIALAFHTAGSVSDFVELMNMRAAELSMCKTHFANPHGLSVEEHYSTAKDMAKLMQACLENDTVREILAIKSCAVKDRSFVNHNKLLYMCKGCTGGKTGYTKAAGRCLVSSCKRNGAELVCVTLNAPDDWDDHMALYDMAFAEYSMRSVTDDICRYVPVISSTVDTAKLVPEKELRFFMKNKSEIHVSEEIPRFVFAPLKAGEKCGRAVIAVDGKYAGEYYLVYSEDIPPETK